MRILLTIFGGFLIVSSFLIGPTYDVIFGYSVAQALLAMFWIIMSGVSFMLVGVLGPDSPLDIPIFFRKKKLRRLRECLEKELEACDEEGDEEGDEEILKGEINAIDVKISQDEMNRKRKRRQSLVHKSRKMIG